MVDDIERPPPLSKSVDPPLALTFLWSPEMHLHWSTFLEKSTSSFNKIMLCYKICFILWSRASDENTSQRAPDLTCMCKTYTWRLGYLMNLLYIFHLGCVTIRNSLEHFEILDIKALDYINNTFTQNLKNWI